MFSIFGINTIFIKEHLTLEEVATFMARNRERIGAVVLYNEITRERSVY